MWQPRPGAPFALTVTVALFTDGAGRVDCEGDGVGGGARKPSVVIPGVGERDQQGTMPKGRGVSADDLRRLRESRCTGGAHPSREGIKLRITPERSGGRSGDEASWQRAPHTDASATFARAGERAPRMAWRDDRRY